MPAETTRDEIILRRSRVIAATLIAEIFHERLHGDDVLAKAMSVFPAVIHSGLQELLRDFEREFAIREANWIEDAGGD